MYELNVEKLKAKASQHGDKSGHAIQKTTGINQTTVYRMLRGGAQPDLITAIRLSVTYDFDLRDVMDEVDEAIEASA
ncbi:helix-turn-helix domain-containing protein [Streptomyces stelliscabiei]|jgi:DNA-binding phage protein|uniref:XRE family transcriptional regulator n=1 Tax=Streptomyces stelliscabiei TaxID=146820 RepID=UPI002FF4214F